MLERLFTIFFSLGALFMLGINFLDFSGIAEIYRRDVDIGGYSARSIGLIIFTLLGLLFVVMAINVSPKRSEKNI